MAQRMRPGHPAQTRTRFRTEAIRFRRRVHMSSIGYGDVSASSVWSRRKASRRRSPMMMTPGERRMGRMYPLMRRKLVLYARMSIGETDLMGRDLTSERFQPMGSVYRSLSVNATDEAERIFALLSNGARFS